MFTGLDSKLAEDLMGVIRFFNQKGWSPATSTNYSVRAESGKEYIITKSGVDKSAFQLGDFICINAEGEILPPFNEGRFKSSAETEIHTYIYKNYPNVNCVLHTHSVLGTVLSHLLLPQKEMTFEGLELLKGLEGNMTHEMKITLPIVPNSQSMPDLLKTLDGRLAGNVHGFLIAGHGLYTWGKDIASAKRHIETYEFLFECYYAMRRF